MTTRQLRRIEALIALHQLCYRDILIIGVFAAGHPTTPLARLITDYGRGVGPAAIAAGRARV